MFTKRHLVWLLALLVIFVAFGCSDDEDPPTGNTTPTLLHIPISNTISVPSGMQNSSDPHAITATTLLNILNLLPTYTLLFDAAGKASTAPGNVGGSADTTIYPVGVYIKIRFWETDTTYHWEYFWDGPYNDTVYVDWMLCAGEQNKAGTRGSFTVYTENTTDQNLKWEWSYVGGVYTVTLTMTSARIDFVIYADGSGTFDYWDGECLVVEITWAADGSGIWIEHSCGGNQGSGSWIAAK